MSGKACGDPGDARLGLLQTLDVLEGGPEDLLDPDETRPVVALGHLEHPLLRLVQDLLHRFLTLIVHVPDDGGGRLDEISEERLFPDDLGVVFDVRSRGDRVQELGQIGKPPGRIQLLGLLQLLAQGDDVDDVPSFEEAGHGPEEPSVGLPVEHGVPDHLDGLGHGVPVDEHPTQIPRPRPPAKRGLPVEGRWEAIPPWDLENSRSGDPSCDGGRE